MNGAPFVVSGGGPAALALALAAAKEMPAVLLSEPPRPAGRFFALGAAAVNFLTAAAAKPFPKNIPVRRFLLCAGGRRQYLNGEDGAPLCRITEEETLSAWLRECLPGSGAALQNGRIAGCRWTKEGAAVQLEDGRELPARLLAVADGARSPAARALRVGAAASFFGQRALSAKLKIRGLEDDTAGQWFARRNVLALLPAGGGVFSLVWSMPDAEARALMSRGAAAVAEAAARRTGFLAVAESAPRDFVLTALRRAARVAPGTAFVGDAARTIHPLAGQGLNLGLADAAFLMRCWRRRKGDAAAVLADYAGGGGRGAALHGITALLNCAGRTAAPLFAAAAPAARPIVRAANCGYFGN
ncbi:MAG: hypothetical protein HAW59_00080 [Betaproteobacteria bacterium]|nr:hypothetical protein [Betaproteobacteria bacterium]